MINALGVGQATDCHFLQCGLDTAVEPGSVAGIFVLRLHCRNYAHYTLCRSCLLICGIPIILILS